MIAFCCLMLAATTARGKLAPARRIKATPRGGGGSMSENAAVVSLAKTIIGGGILALPSGMAAGRGTGVLPAVGIVGLHAALSAYTYTLVGRSVEVTGARDFNDLFTAAGGRGWLIDAMIFGVAAGAILTYGCFLGDLLSSLLPVSRSAAILGLALFPLGPLALARDLSALKHSSIVGLAAVLLSACVVILRSLDGSYGSRFVGGSAAALSQISSARISVGTCVLFNMLSTAFMAHTNAVRAYRELADKSRQVPVALKAFGLSGVLYAAVMIAGYKTFGADAKGLILGNYDSQDPLALATRVATAISLISSHPLLFTSLRDVSSSLLDVDQTKSFTLLSLSLLALFTALALVVPDAGFVVSITGASVGAALIVVVPSLISLNLRKKLQMAKSEIFLLKSMVIFGIAVAAFGSVVTCLETFTDILN